MSVEIALPNPQTTALGAISKVVATATLLREKCRKHRDGNGAIELSRKLQAFYAYIADADALARSGRTTTAHRGRDW